MNISQRDKVFPSRDVTYYTNENERDVIGAP